MASLDEAAAIVIASDSRFSGVTKLDPNMIGASAWWEGQPTATGYAIQITIGWGDCPSGCINRHVWSYSVTPDGAVTLDSETGDPLPPGSLAGLIPLSCSSFASPLGLRGFGEPTPLTFRLG